MMRKVIIIESIKQIIGISTYQADVDWTFTITWSNIFLLYSIELINQTHAPDNVVSKFVGLSN